MTHEPSAASRDFTAIREALARLEALGQQRADSHFRMGAFRRHAQGQSVAAEARRIKRTVGQMEAMFDAWD